MRNLKKILGLVLCLAMILSVMVTGVSAAFTDQDEIDAKHKEDVDVCTVLNIINGYPDGSFKPNGNITRAEMCKMICVLLNGGKEPTLGTTANTFSDVPATNWAAPYIASCVSQEIVAGIGNGMFNPYGNVTGSEAAKMLLIALGFNADRQNYLGAGWDINVNVDASARGFYIDLEDIDPSAALSREHAAEMIWNALNAYEVEYENKLVAVDGQLTTKEVVIDKVVGDNRDKITLLEDKYEAITDTGILTSVKYDSDDNSYSTKVETIRDPFDASVDYSALIGQDVKVIYTYNNKKDDVILLGLYATDKNKTVSALMDDVDVTYSASSGYVTSVEIDGKDYDLARDVAFIGLNGEEFNFTARDFEDIPAYYNITLVDNDKNSEYDYVIIDAFIPAEVDTISSKNIYMDVMDEFTTLYGTKDFNDKVENFVTYEGMEEDDYVVVRDDAYTVSGDYEVAAMDTVSGLVAGVKSNTDVKVDGTWYQKADVCTDNTPSNNKNTEISVVNGFYFFADNTDKTIDDVAMVLAVSKDPKFDSSKWDVKLLLSNGDIVKSEGYVVDGNKKEQPVKGELYTYVAKTDYYKLTELTNGKQVDLDDKGAIHGDFNSATDKVYGASGTVYAGGVRVASDAVVLVMYDGNDGKVLTGAQVNKWSDKVYEGVVAFTDTTVKLMSINLGNDSRTPSSGEDTLYGVILSAPYVYEDDDDTYLAFDLWTKDGLKEDVKVNVDDIDDADSYKDFAKNMPVTYEKDGDSYVELASAATAGYEIGAVTDIDGDYVTISYKDGAQFSEEFKLTSDTVQLFIDSDKHEGVDNGKIKKAASMDSDYYYGNILYVVGDYEDGFYELDAVIVDVNGQYEDANGDSAIFVK